MLDIDRVFYDEKGNFIPIKDTEGIVDGDLTHLRNTYMESEREFFEFLLSQRRMRDVIEILLSHSSEELLEKAMEIQLKLESGMLETEEQLKEMEDMTPEEKDSFHMEILGEAELKMCLLYAVVRDKVKMKQLIKTYKPKSEEEISEKKLKEYYDYYNYYNYLNNDKSDYENDYENPKKGLSK